MLLTLLNVLGCMITFGLIILVAISIGALIVGIWLGSKDDNDNFRD